MAGIWAGLVSLCPWGEKDNGLMPYGMIDLAVDAGTCITRPRWASLVIGQWKI